MALGNRISRRLMLVSGLRGLSGILGLALLGCGSSQGGTAATAVSASSGRPADGLPTGSEWDALLKAAQAEGKLVIGGPPDETRKALPEAFKNQTGIDVEYLSDATATLTRMQAERTAGQYTVDALIAGSDSAYGTLLPKGWLEPVKPILLPEVSAGSGWKMGAPWFRDPQGDTILQIVNDVARTVAVNTSFVKVADIPTAEALLDPQWKGKISSFDPGVNGPGAGIGAALYVSKGQDFVTRLFKGQNVVVSRDYRQLADWLAHGTYPIAIALTYTYFGDLVKAGVPIAQPELSDSPASTAGGFGLLCLVKPAPHPNAARLFINWMASKPGLTAYSQAHTATPLRADIDPTWVPPQMIPQAGAKYLDTYDYDFVTKQRLPIRDFYSRLLSS